MSHATHTRIQHQQTQRRRTLPLRLALAMSAAALLAGCLQKSEPYELASAGNAAYLINRSTGDLLLVDGVRLIPVLPMDAPTRLEEQATEWPLHAPGGVPGVQLTSRTKYRDGFMLYVVSAEPYEGVLSEARTTAGTSPAFLLRMSDADGFPIGEPISLDLRSSTLALDENGTVGSMRWSGSVPMSPAAYSTATSLRFGWVGFPALPGKNATR